MVTLEKNIKSVKSVLTSEDVLVFEFESGSKKKFAVIYADGLIDKNMLEIGRASCRERVFCWV